MNPNDPLADIKKDLPAFSQGSPSNLSFSKGVDKAIKTTGLIASVLSIFAAMGLFRKKNDPFLNSGSKSTGQPSGQSSQSEAPKM